MVPNEVANIQPVYPWEFHSGLWGGEGIVGGFKAPPRQKHQPDYGKPRAWYWYPKLYETVVYSEVLNQVRKRRHTFKKLSDGTYTGLVVFNDTT